ncbi:TRAP transporter small permease subunit [Paracoccus sp. S-4012]|uniref:TRAP transporter small permease n=1 Tax=Paracoccus sp. S-4012 TaxID=2665648 RepID=UPI0012AF488C|nr:TRAP transporter small permease [Paracoccus sp. S-4012]MRX50216.1 TRAP transporter small permease subunit [Paracoccus sp. S-4012]
MTRLPPRRRGLGRALDLLYDGAAVLSALCMVAMFVIILAQMIARWSSVMMPGATEYAGYLMAAGSFLAFAHTLNRGAHIRVGLLLVALGRHRRWAELLCLVIGATASAYVAWFAGRLVYWSGRLGDVSQGQDATPLWIVQAPIAIGAAILAIAFIDNLVTFLRSGHDNILSEDLAEQSHAE